MDKNLFQITYDVLGYSPGGVVTSPKEGETDYTIEIFDGTPEQIDEINERYRKLIDDHNLRRENKNHQIPFCKTVKVNK